MQEERRQQGYLESILVPNDPGRNEAYTNCIKCLKHNARAAVVLKPQLLPQSFLLADLVGMTVAGLAMLVACAAIYVATRYADCRCAPIRAAVSAPHQLVTPHA